MSKMTTAAKAARTAYLRDWQRKNPEKMREYQVRYWTRKAAQIEQAKRENKKDESK